MANSLPAAVLLDFDGTLVDTEPYWMQGEVELLAAHGVPWGIEQASRLCGTSREYSQAVLTAQMAAYGVDVATIDDDEFYQQLCDRVIACINEQGAPWLPGVQALLDDLLANGVPCAVVSASPRCVLDAGLAQFPAGVISVVVDGQMTAQGKPEPDPYLLAAKLLGVDVRDCVVIEDTVSGTAAGRAAGAVVVAVPGQHDVERAPGQVVLKDLVGVSAARLGELFNQVRKQMA